MKLKENMSGKEFDPLATQRATKKYAESDYTISKEHRDLLKE